MGGDVQDVLIEALAQPFVEGAIAALEVEPDLQAANAADRPHLVVDGRIAVVELHQITARSPAKVAQQRGKFGTHRSGDGLHELAAGQACG